jgi:hypothetical protein
MQAASHALHTAAKALEGHPGCPALPGASGTVTWPTLTLANTNTKKNKGVGTCKHAWPLRRGCHPAQWRSTAPGQVIVYAAALDTPSTPSRAWQRVRARSRGCPALAPQLPRSFEPLHTSLLYLILTLQAASFIDSSISRFRKQPHNRF